MDHKELHALIHLIDDPDEVIYAQIKDKLIGLGEEVIPSLEHSWETNDFGLLFQNRVEDIIHCIQFDHVCNELKNWKDKGGVDLLEGAILVARYQYPDLDVDQVVNRVNQLKQDVWLELNDHLTAFEQIKVMNHIIYEVHQFQGNKKNFHAPQNSYINLVLESHTGNPLLLSVIYIVLARMLNIPIYGVNLPNHFVLAYMDTNNLLKAIGEDDGTNILFYINPFSRGTIFQRKEIDEFLDQLNLPKEEKFYQPCTHIEIIQRMILNLIGSYEKLGYPDKVAELEAIKKSMDINEG